MTKTRIFAGVLSRLREEQGFKTAHAFYKNVDGRRSLGLAFSNYKNFERGKSLPQPRRLDRLIEALGLSAGSSQAKELVRAYLISFLGSDKLLRHLAAPETAAAEFPGRQLAEEAARQALAQRTVRLSPEQYKVVSSGPAAYICHTVLANTPGWIERAELARIAGLPAAKLAAPLKALARAGLIELSAGKAKTLFAGKFVARPSAVPSYAWTFSALQKHGWIEKRAELVHISGLITRASKAQMDRYSHHLTDVVNLSAVYGEAKRSEDTAIYFVDGRVYRLFA